MAEKKRKVNKSIDYNAFGKRFLGIVLDFFCWYIIYAILGIIGYLIMYGNPFADGYSSVDYGKVFRTVYFSIAFIVVLIVWEAIIPMFNNGQTLTKKKLSLKVVDTYKETGKIQLFFRGILKLIILNPYNVAGYQLALLTNIHQDRIFMYTALLVVVSMIIHFIGKRQTYDFICGTKVISIPK